MKKRIVCMFLTLFCVTSCAFVFAACNGDAGSTESSSSSESVGGSDSSESAGGSDSEENGEVSSFDGVFYGVFTGEEGWTVFEDVTITFRKDNTCVIEGQDCVYSMTDGLISVTLAGEEYYAKIDGNIFYLFLNAEDAEDVTKAAQFFYAGKELSDADRATLVGLFGDGVSGGNTPQISYTVTEEEWAEAFRWQYKNMTYTIEMPGEASFDKMTVKLTEDGSLHQSAGASWGEHIYKVNSDGTVSFYMKRDGVWEEGEGYDTIEEYEKGNYGDDVGIMKALPEAAVYNSSFVFQEETNSYKGTIDFMGAPTEFEVKFENKKLVSCNIGDMLIVKAYDYGTTEIKMPELSEGQATSVSGKTFVFSDLSSDDATADMLEQAKEQSKGVTMQFSADGTFTMLQPVINCVSKGTYTQTGSEIVFVINSMTIDGKPLESAQLPMKVEGTFDGTTFSYTSEVMPGVFVNNIFVLQTA